MKSIRRVSIILIIAFLLTTPSVIAQDNDPPSILPEPSQNEPFFSEAPLSGSISPDNIKKSKNRATSASQTSSRGVTDVTDVLCLSCINDEAELNPEVAYGGGYYVVAYEEGGAVHANVFNRDGSIHLTVRDIHSNSGTPDVAYEATTGLFLIVWQLDYWDDGSDYDILSIALSPTSGLVGSTIAVSSDNNHERYPSVDCNPAILPAWLLMNMILIQLLTLTAPLWICQQPWVYPAMIRTSIFQQQPMTMVLLSLSAIRDTLLPIPFLMSPQSPGRFTTMFIRRINPLATSTCTARRIWSTPAI